MAFMMTFSLSVLFALMRGVPATLLCQECRPVELQNAPGIGFNLAVGYGTATIRFSNGTAIDITAINGSPSYVTAMKQLAEDAIKVRAGEESSLTKIYYREPQLTRWGSLLYSLPLPFSIYQKIQQIFPTYANNNSASEDPLIIVFADMIRSLYTAVDAIYPLVYHTVWLSLPNFIMNTNAIYDDRFRLSVHHVGLSTFGPYKSFSGHAAMHEFYGISNCFNTPIDWSESKPNPACEYQNGEQILNVLLVEYSEENLELLIMSREDGMFYPDLSRLVERTDLGANCALRSQSPETYWAAVKKAFAEFSHINGHEIDRLLLVGNKATDPELLSIVIDIFKYNKKLRPEEFIRNPVDHLFASARWAAKEARIGMMGGYAGCFQSPRCPVGQEDPWEDAGNSRQERSYEKTMKTEL